MIRFDCVIIATPLVVGELKMFWIVSEAKELWIVTRPDLKC